MCPSIPFTPFNQFTSSIHQSWSSYFYISIESFRDNRLYFIVVDVHRTEINAFEITAASGEIKLVIGAQPEQRSPVVIAGVDCIGSIPQINILVLELFYIKLFETL